MTSDLELLEQYARNRSQDAFTALVKRQVNLVYSAALRQVRSPQLAEEVSQSVFADLARNAGSLARGSDASSQKTLVSWLYAVTRRTAIDVIRKESRRQLREQIAMEMNDMNATANDWTQIEPLLDEAVSALDETDRAAVLLRYFENKSLREVGAALGVSDDTAQKRVSRAVERLRDFFSKRNVTIGASGLAVLISANAVQSAPVGLAATISAAAVLAGTVVHTSTIIAATKTIAMTIIQKTIITATLVVIAGAGIYEAHQAAQLREQNQTLQQQQAPLAEQIQQFQRERDDATNQVAGLLTENEQLRSHSNENELLKLRGQVAPAQANARELAQLKSTLAQQSGARPVYFTNAMAQGVAMTEKFQKMAILAKLDRMKEKLHLTDDQSQAISDLMLKNMEANSQRMLNIMMGKQPDPVTASGLTDEEAEIKALLTPDQLAAYPDYQQAETMTTADNRAKAEVTMMTMTGGIDLSQEQQDKVHAALYQLNLNQASASPSQTAIAQARASGNSADVIAPQIEIQKQNLENELKALDGILTPEQLKTYEQKQLDMIDMQTSAMKMFLPQTNNAVTQ